MTSPSLVQSDVQHNEAMLPGQLTYTFAIQTTAGVDIRNTIATTLWTGIGGEVQGQWQHTGTLTIVLNGADDAATSGVNQEVPHVRRASLSFGCERALHR